MKNIFTDKEFDIRPLGPPRGIIFYMDFVYGEPKPKINLNVIRGRRVSEIDPYGEENWDE